ncbi:MAG: hypothetical protein OEY38_22475 [Gammaproteobacteria bacterium]|nr:hypothetical protein [Gammaproteobacteria bacterium]
MNNLEFKFDVLEPESPEATVSKPQVLVFNEDINTVKVFVYFMENCAVNITEGIAKSAMGKIKLKYKTHSPSETVTACVNLRKILFTFTNAQGIAREFEFENEKT